MRQKALWVEMVLSLNVKGLCWFLALPQSLSYKSYASDHKTREFMCNTFIRGIVLGSEVVKGVCFNSIQ